MESLFNRLLACLLTTHTVYVMCTLLVYAVLVLLASGVGASSSSALL